MVQVPRRRLSALVLAAGAALAACSRARAPAGGAAPAGIEPPPAQVLAPRGLAPGERRPLLILLHGLGGSAEELIDDPQLLAFAVREKLFVVAPDGTRDSQGRQFWNAGGACCNFDRVAVDDVSRIAALIDVWRRRPDIDPRRIYVVGFSNGGFMAHRLACRLGDRVAAVASLSGAGPGPDPHEPCVPRSRLGVLEVHGDTDAIVRYQGGRVFDSPELAPHPSAETTLRDWARRLGCAAGSPPVKQDLDPALPGKETTVQRYQTCPLGVAELWTIHGAAHAMLIPDIMERVWRFLSGFVKPG